MNMNRTTWGALLAVMAIMTGCTAPRMSWQKAQDLYDARRTEKMNEIYYAGSDKTDHYLHHSFLTMCDTGLIRIAKSELTITKEFPVTPDNSKWRKLDIPMRVAPAAATIKITEANKSRRDNPYQPLSLDDYP